MDKFLEVEWLGQWPHTFYISFILPACPLPRTCAIISSDNVTLFYPVPVSRVGPILEAGVLSTTVRRSCNARSNFLMVTILKLWKVGRGEDAVSFLPPTLVSPWFHEMEVEEATNAKEKCVNLVQGIFTSDLYTLYFSQEKQEPPSFVP